MWAQLLSFNCRFFQAIEVVVVSWVVVGFNRRRTITIIIFFIFLFWMAFLFFYGFETRWLIWWLILIHLIIIWILSRLLLHWSILYLIGLVIRLILSSIKFYFSHLISFVCGAASGDHETFLLELDYILLTNTLFNFFYFLLEVVQTRVLIILNLIYYLIFCHLDCILHHRIFHLHFVLSLVSVVAVFPPLHFFILHLLHHFW